MFQSLLGILKSADFKERGYEVYVVSIPPRYSKIGSNLLILLHLFEFVSIPPRYSKI